MSLRYIFNLLRPQVTKSVCLRRNHNEKKMVVYDPFSKAAVKDKKAYIQMIKMFIDNDVRRRGHVEFIYAALSYLEEFGVHKDLEVYKTLLEVLPKGRFIPTNIFQAEFMHFPKQQQCAVDLLEKMEENGVMPDFETQDILMTVFGRRGIPLRRYWRMMYWMPKFRNLSPWYLPHIMPTDSLELAKLAIQRITSVDNDTKITIFDTENVEAALDNTWIVSAQSPAQVALLAAEAKRRKIKEENKQSKQREDEMKMKAEQEQTDQESSKRRSSSLDCRVKSPEEKKLDNPEHDTDPLTVHGPYRVHLRDQLVSYFVLSGPVTVRPREIIDTDDVSNLRIPSPFGSSTVPALQPTVHEQDDGTILAVCATGTSSRDSLLSWIRLLEKHGNPDLGDLGVVFTLLAPPSELAVNITDPVKAE